jgi:hypothetical protein
MQKYITNLQVAWSEVFSRISYIVGAAALALIVFVFAVLLPNLALLNEVVFGSSAPLGTKLNLTISLLGGISTNFSTLSAIYTILIAVLVGVNVAMIVYLVRKRSGMLGQKGAALGVSGIATGALGVGCAACGSFLLSTILASFGAASALAILPLKGGEFGIVSVILLGVTAGMVSNKIAEPLVCEPKENNHE